MSIGRVDSVGAVFNTSAVGRANSLSMRSPVPRVSPVGQWQEPPGNTVEPSGVRYADSGNKNGRQFGWLAGIFYSPDGDSAEISGRAMNLFRGMSGGNYTYQFDLPSPYIDWTVLKNDPNIPAGYQNQFYPDVEPPVVATPAAVPPGIAPPTMGTPNSEIPGTPAPATEPSADFVEALKPNGECKKCANRRYVDRSDDPSVSYQTPTKISAGMSGAAVAAHESEHVQNNRAQANREGRDIIKQSVSITYACCPECGRMYAAGGTTHTTSISRSEDECTEFGIPNPESQGEKQGLK